MVGIRHQLANLSTGLNAYIGSDNGRQCDRSQYRIEVHGELKMSKMTSRGDLYSQGALALFHL
jgi:hypothetical protein